MRSIYLMCGIPGSGKSTWVKDEISKLRTSTYKVISRDVIRFKYLKDTDAYFVNEDRVFKEFIDEINSAITDNIDNIYIDATHITKGSRYKVLDKLSGLEKYNIFVVFFYCSIETAIKNNATRTGRACVPEDAIVNMYERLEIPNIDEYRRHPYYGVLFIHSRCGKGK